MILLNEELSFPDPRCYHPENGLIAAGGDLSPERILVAYQNGIFPWFNEGEEILWWSPDPRFVLFPSELRISDSMRKILKHNIFGLTENQCFEAVMRACAIARRKGQNGTWISEDLIKAFTLLHEAGIAKSYEAWKDGELVGGFYGLSVGKVFCGESMFAKVSNASKAAFINFVKNQTDYDLVDCQIHSNHLESLGAREISKEAFFKILDSA